VLGIADDSLRQDSPGPMGKSPWDLAAVLSCLKETSDRTDYMDAVKLGSTMHIGSFGVGIVRDAHPCTKDIAPEDTAQRAECTALYDKVIAMLDPVVDPVVCPAVDELAKEHDVVGFDADGNWAGIPDYLLTFAAFAEGVNEYLANLGTTEIKTFDDIIRWNNDHPVSRGHSAPRKPTPTDRNSPSIQTQSRETIARTTSKSLRGSSTRKSGIGRPSKRPSCRFSPGGKSSSIT